MAQSRLRELHDAGVSVWRDSIARPVLESGELERAIAEDALTGVTSNPTIFQSALAAGPAYDSQLAAATARSLATWQLFELIEATDVRAACDLFAGVYQGSHGGDGYVSIEVSPAVSHDTHAAVEEARRLWDMVARPNLMVKVPGTEPGAEAVRRLIADGINVNITLLFGIEAYARVIDAYMAGLEERLAAGQPIAQLASVASFFVSRIDTKVDARLEQLIGDAAPEEAEQLRQLMGRAAIANAKLAYRLFSETLSSRRWRELARQGARVQRPLWASTSTKNPAYRDVVYVEELIGPSTVNTMPPATLEAFRDHGVVARTVDRDLPFAEALLADLEACGISMRQVASELLIEGIAGFQASFDAALAGIERKLATLSGSRPGEAATHG